MALDHLAVYLTNSCNLSCSYCYVAVNQGPAVRLSLAQLKRAIDEFFGKVPPPDRKITLLGGEPLLDWKLFQDAVRYARETGGPELVLQTFTNGTTLTPAKLAFLDEWAVHCTISLDGTRADNDKSRTYYKEPGRSVFDSVFERIKPLPKKHLGVSLVFTSETVDRLLSNIDYFSQMGFGRITFNPELYELWPEAKLETMKRVLSGLSRYYRLTLDSRPFQIQILYSVLENAEKSRAGLRWWHDCHNMVLGPDAQYYSCDKALSFPVGDAVSGRTGSTESGLNWTERADQLATATERVEQRGFGKDEYFCPIGVEQYAKHAGIAPDRLLENFHKVAETFSLGLLELVENCKDHPAFEEMYARARVV